MAKLEPLKPSRSGDISRLLFLIFNEVVKQPYCLPKKYDTIFFLKIFLLFVE